MAILGFDLDEIARLLALAESEELDELIVEEEGRKLRIRGSRYRRTEAVTQQVVSPLALPSPSRPQTQRTLPPPHRAEVATAPDADLIALTSPMVGIFYRCNQPGSPPLVEVGQRITVGQPIGIIEAMKVFSEVLAETGGVIAAFPAKDGQLVQTDDPLAFLRLD